MMMSSNSKETTDVTETCNRLEEVQLQLKLIQERNAEILDHLSMVQKMAAEGGITLPSQMAENLSTALQFSKKVDDAVESQSDTLHHSYRELKRLPGGSAQSGDEGGSMEQGQARSALDDDVHPPGERSQTALDLTRRLESLGVDEGSGEHLEERLQSVKDTMLELVETYRENTVKAEEELERVQRDLEAVHERVSGSEHLLDLSIDDSEPSSPAASPIHATPATSLPITSNADDRYLFLLRENERQEMEIRRLTEENWCLIRRSQQTTADIDRLQRHMVYCTTRHGGMEDRSHTEEEMWFGN